MKSESTKTENENSTGNEGAQAADASSQGPVFRINSPSYQAVQYELEQFMQLRQEFILDP